MDRLVVVMPDRTPGNKSDLIDAASWPTICGATPSVARCVQSTGLLQGSARSSADALRAATRQGPHQESTQCVVPRLRASGARQVALRVEDSQRGAEAAPRALAAASSPVRATARQPARVLGSGRADAARGERSGADRAETFYSSCGLNHNRHPLLKNVFKGAALQITLMPEHPLGQAYQRLLMTTKPNLARLTIARRLAAAVLAMWKHGEDYQPTKHGGTAKTM